MLKHRNKIQNIFAFAFLLVIGCFMVAESVRCIIADIHVNNQQTITKVCSFEFIKVYRSERAPDMFILEDGERLYIPNAILNNRDQIDQHLELCFTFVKPMGGLRHSYSVVEVSSCDKTLYFVDRDIAVREIKLGIFVYLLIAISVFFLCAMPLYFNVINQGRPKSKKKPRRHADIPNQRKGGQGDGSVVP